MQTSTRSKRYIYIKPDIDHMFIIDIKTGQFLGYANLDKNVNIMLGRDGVWQTGPRWRTFTPNGEEIGQFGREYVAMALFRQIKLDKIRFDRLKKMELI